MINAKYKGQTLFELVIALAVVVMVITGIVHAVTTAIKNSTFARNKSEATRVAQETLEWAKAQRDKNSWDGFTGDVGSLTSDSCMPTLAWPSPGLCNLGSDSDKITGTIFFREIKVEDVNNTQCSDTDTSCDITTKVFWLDGSTTHTSTLQTRVTNWREAQ